MIDFVSKVHSQSTLVVQLSGNLNDSSRDYFFDCIAETIGPDIQHVVIECHQLGFISSSGLASLLTARKRALTKGCKISLTHINSSISQVLEITKLGRILSVYPTTAEALKSMKGRLACVG